MITALALAMVIAATVVVTGFLIRQRINAHFSNEVVDFLSKARTAESKIQGIAVFQPKDGKSIHFFEKMTAKGYVVRNPLSTGGYIISDSQKALWNQDANIRSGDVVHVKSDDLTISENK